MRYLPLMLLLCGCPTDPCQDGSMVEGDAGLELTEDEHGAGWGQEDCAGCHSFAALHRVSCTDGVDLGAIRDQVEDEGIDACFECHGDNGVEP